MRMTVHPTRQGPGEGAWYGDICVPGNTAYLILGERSLVRLAELAGDKALAARRRPRIEKAVQAMHQHMWDEKAQDHRQGHLLADRRVGRQPLVPRGSLPE